MPPRSSPSSPDITNIADPFKEPVQFKRIPSNTTNVGEARAEILAHEIAAGLSEESHYNQIKIDAPDAHLLSSPNPILYHQQLRIAKNYKLLNRRFQLSGVLLTPLATFGCVSVNISSLPPLLQPSASSLNAELSIDLLVLTCGFCNASIPVADVFSRIAHSKYAQRTAELLELLEREHAVECRGRKALKQLQEDDDMFGVSESSTNQCSSISLVKKFEDEWAETIKTKETVKILYSRGNIIHTHPELFRQIISKFPVLTPDKLKFTISTFWLSPETEPHAPFVQLPHPRLTALKYFFVQTPPDQSGSQPAQIRYADALRRIREVHYDRGTIVNAMDIEAKEMADCRKRYDSFSKSELLRGKVAAYQLSQLGFFFVGDRNSPGKLRCSFCRRTIHMFTTDDAPYLEQDFDRRLMALLRRHAHLSATCPFTLGLNGDDKRFSTDDMARVIEPLVRTQSVQLAYNNLCSQPATDSTNLRISAASVISQYANGLPPLDGDMSNSYNNAIAELEYEMFSPFELESDFECDISVVDDLTPNATPIDYFIGVQPKYSNYKTLQSRIDSFDVDAWRQHSISRTNSPHLTPESFARAGFYFAGAADNVMCFWCGLGLNHWEATDDPVSEHVRFTPRCTWLLRSIGRQRVKYIYLKANGSPAEPTTVQNIKPTDYAFIRDVDDIAGWLDQEHLCPVDFRTELREAKARVDLPAHRAILDEFGFSQDLLLHALESQLRETGNDFTSAQQLLESLWAYEEWKNEKHIDSDADFVARADELRRHFTESALATSSTTTRATGDAASTHTQQMIDAQDSICVVCMSAARSVVLIPCGHLAVCQSCYGRLQQCPICRSVIRGAIRSYIA